MAERLINGTELDDLLRAVRLEFDEMPGLALTAEQARRLWALDSGVCSRVLRHLVDSGYLDVNEVGMYVRPTAA